MSSDIENRQRVMRKIEKIFKSFQQVLKAGSRPTLFLPEAGVDAGILELRSTNPQRFLYTSQILVEIYEMLKTNTYRTKRELFEKHKHIYGNQATFDSSLIFVTHLVQESRINLHVQREGIVILTPLQDDDKPDISMTTSQHTQSSSSTSQISKSNTILLSQESKSEGYFSQISQDSKDQLVLSTQGSSNFITSFPMLPPHIDFEFKPPNLDSASAIIIIETNVDDEKPDVEEEKLEPPATPIPATAEEVEPAPVVNEEVETPAIPVAATEAAQPPPQKKRAPRKRKNDDDGGRRVTRKYFKADIKKLIETGYFQAYEVLEYTEPEDGFYIAHVQPNGVLKAIGGDNQTHPTIESWLRSILKMPKRLRAGLDNESKRIICRKRPMITWVREMEDKGAVSSLRLKCQSGTWSVV